MGYVMVFKTGIFHILLSNLHRQSWNTTTLGQDHVRPCPRVSCLSSDRAYPSVTIKATLSEQIVLTPSLISQ